MASGGISIRGLLRVLFLLPGLVLPAACGGQGTLVAGGGTGGTGISTGSITAVGSITVNGVKFDITDAAVQPDNTVLGEGMVVVVRGDFHPDGLNGIARDIKVEREVRGAVSAMGSDTLTVLGQTVVVTGATVFAGAQQLRQIVAGNAVEVHGFRNAAGTIVATRVERLYGEVQDEIRGPLADLTDSSVSIGSATFTYDEDTDIVVPESTAFEVGAIVEVRLDAGTTRASRIEVEDEQDPVFTPADGEKFEVEGFVSGFAGIDAPFVVGGRTVDGSNARVKGGLPSDLRDGILVEAKGRYFSGVLVADEIELEDSVEIEATIETKAADRFTVFGNVTVLVTSRTVQEPPGFFDAAIAGTTRVELRGFENPDGTITAVRLDEGDGDGDVLQGIVTSFDAGSRTLAILGITVTTSGATVFESDRDDGDDAVSASEFFGSLAAGRTIVKAEGIFDAATNTLAATEVEVE